MLTVKDFSINKCVDCIRVTRINDEEDCHTHLKSLRLANKLVQCCINKTVPYDSSIRFLESLIRISPDIDQQNKCIELISAKKNRGKREYYNPMLKNR